MPPAPNLVCQVTPSSKHVGTTPWREFPVFSSVDRGPVIGAWPLGAVETFQAKNPNVLLTHPFYTTPVDEVMSCRVEYKIDTYYYDCGVNERDENRQ